MEKHLSRDAFAEGIGTFMLVLFGAGTGALLNADNTSAKLLAVALAHGLALVAIIYTYGHVSGAHVNPAVTMGLLVGGHIKLQRAVFYWIAQLIGAALAAGFLKLFIAPNGGLAVLGETTGTLTTSALPNALAVEFILTFILVSVVTHAAVFGKAGPVAGLGIGLTLAAGIIFAGGLTGASLNPARTFGPALLQGNLLSGYCIPYMIAILLGGAAAGYIQNAFFAAPPTPTPTEVKRSKRS